MSLIAERNRNNKTKTIAEAKQTRKTANGKKKVNLEKSKPSAKIELEIKPIVF